MTCIAAIKHHGVVTMGADSMCSYYGLKCTSQDPKIVKLSPNGSVRLDEKLLIGIAGKIQTIAVMQRWAAPERDGLTPTAYIRAAGRAIKTYVEEEGLTWLNEDKNNHVGYMLIAFDGELGMVDGAGGLFFPDAVYHAIGSGEEIALGAMHALGNQLSPELTVIAALQAATDHSQHVGPPFHLFRTDGQSVLG